MHIYSLKEKVHDLYYGTVGIQAMFLCQPRFILFFCILSYDGRLATVISSTVIGELISLKDVFDTHFVTDQDVKYTFILKG